MLTAAGFSSRMGSLKALLDWKGKPLILHQLEALAGFGQIVVVTGHEAERLSPFILPPAVEARNPDFASGRTKSLLCGFSSLKPCAAVLVCAIDQPIEPGLPQKLLQALLENETAGYAFPRFEEKKGHPLFFKESLLPELLEIRDESEGLRAIVRRHAAEAIAVPWDSPSVLLDLNTPDDLGRK